jgi:hypothetical protein
VPTCNDESGEHKPFYDQKQSFRRDDKGNRRGDEIKDYRDDHNRHHTEFERRSNVGVTHDQMAHDYSKRHVPSYERRGELGLDRPDSNPKPRR